MMPSFALGKTTISQISRAYSKKLYDSAIKDWHFEKCVGGVKPVVGKFNPTNPAHIKQSKVVRIYP